MARQATDAPNNDKDMTWQKRMEDRYKGRPRETGRELPEGTFEKSSSEIVHLLKMHSKDYNQAQSKLNSFINRMGRNLQGADKSRLYNAKEALKNAYGISDSQSDATASAYYPLYVLPPGHNLDDPELSVGLDEEPDGKFIQTPDDDTLGINGDQGQVINAKGAQMKTQAATRLAADKWVKNTHPDHNAVPEGTFKKSADKIVKTLERDSDSLGQASKRLNYYKNRGGSNLSPAERKKLDRAADEIHEDVEKKK